MIEMFWKNKYHFQQDGAPAHRANKSVTWLEDQSQLINDWPRIPHTLAVLKTCGDSQI